MVEPLASGLGHRCEERDRSTADVAPLVPPGARFTGLLDVRAGAARIDGTVDGEIIAAESLWIGAEARVQARVEADQVIVEGSVEGEIWAASKIDLRATARVRADLHTRRFILAEGALFEGRCHTIPGASAAPATPKTPPGTP